MAKFITDGSQIFNVELLQTVEYWDHGELHIQFKECTYDKSHIYFHETFYKEYEGSKEIIRYIFMEVINFLKNKDEIFLNIDNDVHIKYLNRLPKHK